MAELPGVDLAALAQWLDAERPGLRQGELSGEVIAGGKSNLTYRITDGTSAWALRRPPLAHVLPTAHDMTREYRVISALVPTDVPVPETIALCTDRDVIGADFYLMSFVDAVVLDRAEVLAALSPERAARACKQLIDTLVLLHDIEPEAVGLGDFGRPEGFLARQVRRWHQQWQANETQPREIIATLFDRLNSTVPPQSPPGIVHGDYRLTNVMFRPDLDAIAAVVDWEMATLGDPLTDLGLLVVYQTLSADTGFVMPPMNPGDGFLTPDEMVARYAARSERDISNLDWYVGFGYFKLAVISEGIHNRYLQGKTVGAGFDHFGDRVPALLDSALLSLAAR
ncbi:MAG TPA: phosphotransferase family protein [Jatrophihabitantaceae bacterium]